MENASKALVMAGGVLIALLVIGSLVYMWMTYGNFSSNVNTSRKTAQISEFNAQFESYVRQVLRGNDIASIINKIRNNNIKNEGRHIIWEFELVEGIAGLKEGKYNESNYDKYQQMTNNSSYFSDFKTLFFICSETDYDTDTGYINKITFRQKTYSELFL